MNWEHPKPGITKTVYERAGVDWDFLLHGRRWGVSI